LLSSVAVVVVPVESVVEFVSSGPVVVLVVVLMGRVGTVGSVVRVTVGSVTEGTVVVTQPMTGKQSCGAAGTDLE